MDRLWQTVEQLLEAKRLLEKDDLPSLRMALLLVDNAAEILMHRAIRRTLHGDLGVGELLERSKDRFTSAEYEDRLRIFGLPVVSKSKRKEIDRDFGKKADFLVTFRRLEAPEADVLKALHRYRNEAHHRDQTRKETIGSAVAVGLDLLIDLLPRLQPRTTGLTGSEADIALTEQFGQSWSRGQLRGVQRQLRTEFPLDLLEVAERLANHLADRLLDLEVAVEMVSGGAFTSTTEEEQKLQDWCRLGSDEDLKRWRSGAEALRIERTKLDLFRKFVSLETEIEEKEGAIDLADDILTDQELAADVFRGK